MNAKKRRSKKRSEASSEQQPDDFVLYLDRSLGKHVIANALIEAGHRVEIHDAHLPIDAPDEDWIALVARNGWIAVTKDKNIRYRKGEIEAIKSFEARVIVVRAKNATGSDIADLLVRHHKQIRRYSDRTHAPFVAGVDRSGSITTYNI